MASSYIVEYAVPANDSRPADAGSFQGDTLFFAYEDILFRLAEFPGTGAVYSLYRTSPTGAPDGEPLLVVRRNADGSIAESGPLALPPRGHRHPPCPGCSSETGICFHRVSPALSHIHRGGRHIGEIATLADAGAPDGTLYSVLIESDPVAQFRVSDPSELLPRVIERVQANPRFH